MRQHRLTEAQIRSLLGRHAAVDNAARELGCSARSLRDRCQVLGLGPPATLLAQRSPGAPPTNDTSLTLVVPDMHFPYHDKVVWTVILQAITALQPQNIVIIGDALDAYPISFHPKTPARRATLRDELAIADVELITLADACRGRRVIYCEGNHEHRLERYLIQNAPALYGLIDMPTLLKIEERGWEWVPYQDWIRIGKIAYSHEVGACGKNAAQQTLAAFGNNIVFGHSHRGGLVYSGTVDGERHVALNVGWGGDADAVDYMHKARTREWQHGFGLVEQDATGAGWCQFVPVINGRCVAHGRVIRG